MSDQASVRADRPRPELDGRVGRTLLVASTGGHLEQLWRLCQRFAPVLEDVEWATFDDAHSQSLLADEIVHHVPWIPPRGYSQLARTLPDARRILDHGGYDRVISTGAGIALAFLPIARARGSSVHYIESAARAAGPSLTGRLVSRIPGTHTYTQYRAWAGPRWHHRGSLFDGYTWRRAPGPAGARRVVVTLGTMRRYGFRQAVEAIVRVLPGVLATDAEVLWQVGTTDCTGLPLHGEVDVPAARLHAAIAEADLVIAHAGIGSCLAALDAGRCPVVLPRRHAEGEHVDDHQALIAGELARRHLAVQRLPGELTTADLHEAMSRRVVAPTAPQQFVLEGAA